MPKRNAPPAWLLDPQERNRFLALLATLDTTKVLPSHIVDSDAAPYPFAQRVRDVDANEGILDESTWAELDAAGFPWRPPRTQRNFVSHLAQLPSVSIQEPTPKRALRQSTLNELADGRIALADLVALRAIPGMQSDPVAVWLDRGHMIMRAHQISIIAICAQPDRTVLRGEGRFAIGAWLREVRRAASDTELADVRAQVRRRFSHAEFMILQNLGLVERYYANRPLVPLPTNYAVVFPDGEVRPGRWIHACRAQIRTGTAPDSLAEALKVAGVVLDPRPGFREWTLGLRALEQFYAREHHWRPERKHIEVLPNGSRVALRKFIVEIVREHDANALVPYQTEQLRAIGFKLNDRLAITDRHFAERLIDLDAYLAQRGHSEFSANDFYVRPDGTRIELGRWIMHLRQMATAGTLTDARREALETRNIRVDSLPRSRHLDAGLQALRQFIAREGHTQVPGPWIELLPDGTMHPLGRWLAGQRSEYRRGRLSEARKEQLRRLGVDLDVFFDTERRWQAALDALQIFHRREGHLCVTRAQREVLPDGTTIELGIWFRRQRELYRAGRLGAQRAMALEALGVEWQPHEANFAVGYRLLLEFQRQHGHLEVPSSYKAIDQEGAPFPLGRWLAIRRRSMRRKTLSAEHETALRTLGVDPVNRYERQVVMGTQALEQFVTQHGHCAVPAHATVVLADGSPFALGTWVGNVRRQHRVGRLSTDFIADLDRMGFVWDDAANRWNWNLAAYDRFLADGGRGRPPANYLALHPDGKAVDLRVWLDTQLRRNRAGLLSDRERSALVTRNLLTLTPDPRSIAVQPDKSVGRS